MALLFPTVEQEAVLDNYSLEHVHDVMIREGKVKDCMNYISNTGCVGYFTFSNEDFCESFGISESKLSEYEAIYSRADFDVLRRYQNGDHNERVTPNIMAGYDCSNIGEYHNAIIQSYINGQKAQVREMIGNMDEKQKKDFLAIGTAMRDTNMADYVRRAWEYAQNVTVTLL